MAVVQISRIQLRRGKKNSGSGLPQLASGEMGWAVDSQELYIGNGSVAEGAPSVGNTEILTEHTNLFSFAEQYTYKTDDALIQTGATDNSPIKRTLQSKMDDIVYVADFGAKGDNTTDDTVAIQRAIDQLFLNSDKVNAESRVELHFGAGSYKITNSLKLPPFAKLYGAGVDGTEIIQCSNNPIFTNVTSASAFNPGTDVMVYDTNTLFENSQLKQTRGVVVDGFTFKHSLVDLDGAAITIQKNVFELTSIKDSVFKNLKLSGQWGTSSNYTVNTGEAGFDIRSIQSSSYPSKNNTFNNIKIENLSEAVTSSYDIYDNTFDNLDVFNCGYGVVLGKNMPAVTPSNLADKIAEGQAYGPTNTVIKNSIMDDVFKQGVWVAKGVNNKSLDNTYHKVGNDGGSSTTAVTSIVKFETQGNVSTDDWFQRTQDLSYGTTFVTVNTSSSNYPNYDEDTVPYIPEIEGSFISTSNVVNTIPLTYTPNNEVTSFRLPANETRQFKIRYVYNVTVNFTRTGVLTVDINREDDTIKVTDDYDATGLVTTYGESIVFSGHLVNVSGALGVDTAYIECYNTINNDATLDFTIESRS